MEHLTTTFDGQKGALQELFATLGTTMRFEAGRTIVAQGQPQRSVYRVERGCVRSCVYLEAGSRSILQFLGPGDILGLVSGPEWGSSLEAVDRVVLQAIPTKTFTAALANRPRAQVEVREYLGEQVAAHAAHLVLTVHAPALDRVRTFLRAYIEKYGAQEFAALPMKRRDIADHLGLSTETVSRSISALRAAGEIELDGTSDVRFLQADSSEIAHAA